MNMAGNPAPPQTELIQWLGSDDAVPDIVVVGVQDAIHTGANSIKLKLDQIDLRLENLDPGKEIHVRLSTKKASEDVSLEHMIKPDRDALSQKSTGCVSADHRVVVEINEEVQNLSSDQVLLVEVLVPSAKRSGRHLWTGISDYWGLVSFASLSGRGNEKGKIYRRQPLWAKRESGHDVASEMHKSDDGSEVLVTWSTISQPSSAVSTTDVLLQPAASGNIDDDGEHKQETELVDISAAPKVFHEPQENPVLSKIQNENIPWGVPQGNDLASDDEDNNDPLQTRERAGKARTMYKAKRAAADHDATDPTVWIYSSTDEAGSNKRLHQTMCNGCLMTPIVGARYVGVEDSGTQGMSCFSLCEDCAGQSHKRTVMLKLDTTDDLETDASAWAINQHQRRHRDGESLSNTVVEALDLTHHAYDVVSEAWQDKNCIILLARTKLKRELQLDRTKVVPFRHGLDSRMKLWASAPKGAVGLAFRIEGLSFCFVTAHLQATANDTLLPHTNEEFCSIRNAQIAEVWKSFREAATMQESTTSVCADGTDFTDSHHFTFFFGDLNYRLSDQSWQCFPTDIDKPWEKEEISRKDYSQKMTDFMHLTDRKEWVDGKPPTEAEKIKRWRNLFAHDQLRREMRAGKILDGFREMEPSFPPTFKFEMDKVEGQEKRRLPLTYKSQRQPAYCDRVLWKALPSVKSLIRQDSWEVPQGIGHCSKEIPRGLSTSDHNPVAANFTIFVPQQPARVQEELQAEGTPAIPNQPLQWEYLDRKKWKIWEQLSEDDENKLHEEYQGYMHRRTLHYAHKRAYDDINALEQTVGQQLCNICAVSVKCCTGCGTPEQHSSANELDQSYTINLSRYDVQLGESGTSRYGDYVATAYETGKSPHSSRRRSPKGLKVRPVNPKLVISLEDLTIEEGSGLQVLRQVSQKYSGSKLPSWELLAAEFAPQALDSTAPNSVMKYRVTIACPDIQQESHGRTSKDAIRHGLLTWERGSPEVANVRGQSPEWRKPGDGALWDRYNTWPEIRTPYHSMAVLSHEFIDPQTHFDHAFHHTVVLCVWGGDKSSKDDEDYLGCAPLSLDRLEWSLYHDEHADQRWKAVKRFSGIGLQRHGVRCDGVSLSGSFEMSLNRDDSETLSHTYHNSFAQTRKLVIACGFLMALSGAVSAVMDSLMMLTSSEDLLGFWWPMSKMLVIPSVIFAGYACDRNSYVHMQRDEQTLEASKRCICSMPTLQHTCSFGWFVGTWSGVFLWICTYAAGSSDAVIALGGLSMVCVSIQQGLCLLSLVMMLQDLLGTAARRGVSKWQAFAVGFAFYYASRLVTMKAIQVKTEECGDLGYMSHSESNAFEQALGLDRCTPVIRTGAGTLGVLCLLGLIGLMRFRPTVGYRIAELTKLANQYANETKQHKRMKRSNTAGLELNGTTHVLARGFSPETGEWVGADLVRSTKRDAPIAGNETVGYVARCRVEDERVSWDVPWSQYAPREYMGHGQFENTLDADDTDATQIEDMDTRFSFEGDVMVDPLSNRPRNPRGRTGLVGRGDFCRWGPNHRIDIVITKPQDIETNAGVEVAYIKLAGSNRQAIFGSQYQDSTDMGDRWEAAKACLLSKAFGLHKDLISTTSEQQRYENVQALMNSQWQDANDHPIVYQGYVDDPRNTDNAWSETCAFHIHVNHDTFKLLHEELKFKGSFTLLPDLKHKSQQRWRSVWNSWAHAELAILSTARARRLMDQREDELSSTMEEVLPGYAEYGWGPVHALGPWLHCLLVHSFASGYLSSIPKSWCAFQLNPNDACGRDHCTDVETTWSVGAAVALLVAGVASWVRTRRNSTPPGWSSKRGVFGVQHWSSFFIVYLPMIFVALLAIWALDEVQPICDENLETCMRSIYIPEKIGFSTLSAYKPLIGVYGTSNCSEARASNDGDENRVRAELEWTTMWIMGWLNGAALGFSLAFFFAALMARSHVPERGRAVATAMAVVLFGCNTGHMLGFRRSNSSLSVKTAQGDYGGWDAGMIIVISVLLLLIPAVLCVAECRAQPCIQMEDKTNAYKAGTRLDLYTPYTRGPCGKKIARSTVPLLANMLALLSLLATTQAVWLAGAGHGNLARRHAVLVVVLLLLLSMALGIWTAVTRDPHAGPRKRAAAINRAFQVLSPSRGENTGV